MHSIEGQSGYGAAIPPQRLKTVPVPDEPGPAPALVIALTSGLDRVSLDESYIDVATDCKEFCWNFFIPTGALAMHWPATLPELLTCLRSIESFWFVLGGCAPARPWKTRIDSHHRCHASQRTAAWFAVLTPRKRTHQLPTSYPGLLRMLVARNHSGYCRARLLVLLPASLGLKITQAIAWDITGCMAHGRLRNQLGHP